MAERRYDIKAGDIVVSFKRELLEKDILIARPFKHIYRVIGEGFDTENQISVVIYQPLDPTDSRDFGFFVRPKTMFYDRVDRQKYPDVKQEYRLQRIDIGVSL